jgi:hypothetical protein
MSKKNPRPKKCLAINPTTKSILFCGEFINMGCIARESGLSLSYISLLFSGKREPSLRAAGEISKSLGMGLEEFLFGLRKENGYRKQYNPSAK